MTDATEERLGRFLLTLSVHAPNLDLQQMEGILRHMLQATEDDERNRTLTLVAAADRHLNSNRGRGWRQELQRLREEIDIGTQFLPFVVEGAD